MLAKAAGLAPDVVMLDLEDAVAPARKDEARALVVEAIAGLEWQAATVAVRINPVGSRWCLDDVTALLDGAGSRLDLLIVPKVEAASQVHFLDHLLAALERRQRRDRPRSGSISRSRRCSASTAARRWRARPVASRRSCSGRATTRPRSGSRS